MKPIQFLATLTEAGFINKSQSVKVKPITGGYIIDILLFFEKFESIETIDYEHFNQPHANHALIKYVADSSDDLKLNDKWRHLSKTEIQAYIATASYCCRQ